MRQIGLFIQDEDGTYNRIELHQDEKIQINSSVQDIADIASTKTDFSQSFSVPASIVNNKIFSHWYDNAVDFGFSHLSKKQAYIEIDTILFRTGVLNLEGVDMDGALPINYRLTFFGGLVSLKDLFNGLSLIDLINDTSFDFVYTPALVKSKVTSGADDDVMFPLITSDRVWDYGSTIPANNIANVAGAIKYDELFPAIKVRAIFDMIATQFGITFTGSFLSSNDFNFLFLWLKNQDAFTIKELPKLVPFNTFVRTNLDGHPTLPVLFNDTNDTFTIQPGLNRYADIIVSINNQGTVGVGYTLLLYRDGVQFGQTSSATVATGTIQTFTLKQHNYSSGTFEIRVTSNANVVLDVSTRVNVYYNLQSTGAQVQTDYYTITNSTSFTRTASSNISISRLFPDMKIEDFFTGILKLFNLTCYSTESNVFTLETLEDFYQSGNIIPITKYLVAETNPIDRVKSFKTVKFKYQKSENLLSVDFLGRAGREFGDLVQDFKADGPDYSVNLPFELLSYSSFGSGFLGNMIVGYSLKLDFNKYIPKPLLMFRNTTGTSFGTFQFNDGTSTTTQTAYVVFANETTIIAGNTYQNLAFGNEFSIYGNAFSIYGNVASTIGIYQNFYQNYLQNIFNIKTRNLKVKAVLPLSLITTLRLKDRLVIRDKRYIINSFTTDLNTLEVVFDLITDSRDIL